MHRTILALALLAATGCTFSSHSSYFRGSTGDSIYERHGNGPLMVACYREGQIHGADSTHLADAERFSWLGSYERVDHPDIPKWRGQLENMRTLAGVETSTGAEMVRATRGFPFSVAVERAIDEWVGNRPDRAADLLDYAADLDVNDRIAERVAMTALRHEGVGDMRLAEWVRGLTQEDHDEAVVAIVTHPAADVLTGREALARIDDYSSRNRRKIFESVAAPLARDPGSATRLIDAVDELPSRDEAPALQTLLEGQVSTDFLRQVLRTLDDRSSSSRAELFSRAAHAGHEDPRNHYAILSGLAEVPSSRRADAAISLVRRGDISSELTRMLIAAVNDLPSRDREEFLSAVIDGPHGGDPTVRARVRDAAEDELGSRARKRISRRLGDD